jgi:hypothetical protein
LAKVDSVGSGLIPIAVAAGLISGGVMRTPPQAGPAKPLQAATAPAESGAEKAKPAPPLSDLKPVLELLGQSLGVSVEPDEALRALRALRLERQAGQKPDRLVTALAELEQVLADRSSETTKLTDDDPLQQLDAYLRSDVDPEAQLHKMQSTLANRLFEELREEDALARLAAAVTRKDGPTIDVRFMIATIPDYVDSNSGWVADEVLNAVQSAMGKANFVLDRFRLIDWTPADDAHPDRISESKLHERQPGALVFRKVRPNATDDVKQIRLQVVLLVLETPTSGVHRVALKNAMNFVERWNRAVNRATGRENGATVRLVAPVFSGSMPSLAQELGSWKGSAAVQVVTGSAMATENPDIMKAFAPNVTFQSTVPPMSVVMHALGRTLGWMKPAWGRGTGVALLVEGNTVFGNSALPPSVAGSKTSEEFADVKFQPEFRYPFPLHIAELRSDAQSNPATTPISLLPAPIVPLSLREATPPADQVPALKPQLTTAVVEATLDSILDNIRHENVSAVGIVATDARDVLFLAREVKKHAPDVQLFFSGAYLLYLHPDYIPYTRGAIVAAPYPLSLNVQRGVRVALGSDGTERRTVDKHPFSAMISAGIFNAVLAQLGESRRMIDYCDPAASAAAADPLPCVPPVWTSVIGDDGYWPLSGQARPARAAYSFEGAPPPLRQVPMPGTAKLVASLGGILFLALMWASVQCCLGLKRSDRYYVGLPLIRDLATPLAVRPIGWLRAVMLALGAFGFSSLIAWFAAVVMMQLWSGGSAGERWRPMLDIAAAVVFAFTLAPCLALVWKSLRWDEAESTPATAVTWSWWSSAVTIGCSLLVIGSLAAFLRFTHGTIHNGNAAATAFRIQRYLAGGIVSPAPISICLIAALLAGLVAIARRLSQVGSGYTALGESSPAFRLLAGGPLVWQHLADHPQESPVWDQVVHRFATLIDMPVHNLPPTYVISVVVGLAIAFFSVSGVATIEGRSFALFVELASFAVLVVGLLLVAQADAIWGELQPKLTMLVRSKVERAIGVAGSVVRWELSIVPPRLAELMPLAVRAAQLRDEIASIGVHQPGARVVAGFPDRRGAHATVLQESWEQPGAFVRQHDLFELRAALTKRVPEVIESLHAEILEQPGAPLLQSKSWGQLWRIGDELVDALERAHWKRCWGKDCHGGSSKDEAQPDVLGKRETAGEGPSTDRWFSECEEFVALQYAFLLRDVVARIMSALFAAMLCLTLLTASHLFYLFQGRSSLLTADLFAVGVAAIVALRIVIGLERDAIISRLRVTTPGRIDFNWDFVKRVGLYGVLPLLAVIGSLFPEIGDSFFGWLEPIRKLASF